MITSHRRREKKMVSINNDLVQRFLNTIGYDEEPMGMHFTDTQPTEGFSPKPMELPTAEKEARNAINFEEVFKNHSCVLKNILLARRKKTAAYFDEERYGCAGAAFYLGYTKPLMEFVVHYVSTGIPGLMENCERYIESPDAARELYNVKMDPVLASNRFCVVKPLSQFTESEKPEVVIFFARPEIIAGLYCQSYFVTNDSDVVMSPAGSGCAQIITWPKKYLSQGKLKAVVGGWDPSCRPYLKTDELTFTVPFELFERMINRCAESFLNEHAWQTNKKKIAKSKKTWGEEAQA